jgi:hypothetical protein
VHLSGAAAQFSGRLGALPMQPRMSTSVPPPGYEPPQAYGSAPTPASPPVVLSPATRRPARSKLVAAGLALLVAVGVAFVALGSTNSPVTDPIAQAATLSSGTPGYRMNMFLTISSPSESTPISASANGIVDLRDNAASMSFAIDLSQEPQAEQELGSTTMQMGMVLDQGTMYARFPQAVINALPSLGGKPWLKVDLSKMAGVPGLSSLDNNPTMSNPSHVLEYLRAASDGVGDEGTQVVDGALTTHYSAVVNLDQLSANVPAVEQASVERVLSELEQTTGMHAFPINVWVDAHHLVRRVEMAMSMHAGGGEAVQEDMTVDFSDYGPQQRPSPPPADQVTDLDSLIHVSDG